MWGKQKRGWGLGFVQEFGIHGAVFVGDEVPVEVFGPLAGGGAHFFEGVAIFLKPEEFFDPFGWVVVVGHDEVAVVTDVFRDAADAIGHDWGTAGHTLEENVVSGAVEHWHAEEVSALIFPQHIGFRQVGQEMNGGYIFVTRFFVRSRTDTPFEAFGWEVAGDLRGEGVVALGIAEQEEAEFMWGVWAHMCWGEEGEVHAVKNSLNTFWGEVWRDEGALGLGSEDDPVGL